MALGGYTPRTNNPGKGFTTSASNPLRPSQQFDKDFLRHAHERALCQEDITYFFATYLKIYETRPAFGIGYKPFKLWPRQVEYLHILEAALQNRHGLVVEKCRDMGATLVTLGWIFYHWLFDDDFHALLGSLKEDEVKLVSSHDSLFAKLRDFLTQLPDWLLPAGFVLDKDLMSLTLTNPATSNSITGSSCTENFGRSRRSTVILRDESAFWPFDTSGNTVYTSDTVLDVSTVNGMNHFYEQAEKAKEQGRHFVFSWDENPNHNLDWFREKQSTSPPHIFAREVLRKYDASVEGQIYPGINDCEKAGHYPYNYAWPLYCIWDYGYSDATYLGFLQRNPETGDLYMIDEVVHNGVGIEWFVPFVPGKVVTQSDYRYSPEEVEKIRQHAAWRHGEVKHFGDPTGNQRSAATGKSVFDVLKNYGIKPRCGRGSQNMPHRQECATKVLRRLSIDKKCEYFVTSFSQYVVPRGTASETTNAKIKGVHKWSHAVSALEYFAISEPPLEEKPKPQITANNVWAFKRAR
jgi:hypothetical protein